MVQQRHLWLAAAGLFFLVGAFGVRSLFSRQTLERPTVEQPEQASTPTPYVVVPPVSTPYRPPAPTLNVSLLDQSVNYGEYKLPEWKDTYKVILPKGDWYDAGIPIIANYHIDINDFERNTDKKWESKLNGTVYIADKDYNGNYKTNIDRLEEGEDISPFFLETLKLRYPEGGSPYLTLRVFVSFNREPQCGGFWDGGKTPECDKKRAMRKQMQSKMVALRNKISGSELWR